MNKTHFKPEEVLLYSYIFAELRGLRPLNPHQSSALEPLRGAYSILQDSQLKPMPQNFFRMQQCKHYKRWVR